MADVVVEGGELVLRLPLAQKIAGIHTDIRAPLTAVRSVKALDKPWLALRGRRMAGVALRGVTAIGTWIHGDREFDYYVLRKHHGSAIQVDLNAGRFSRWIVGLPAGADARAEADRIADAAGIRRS